MTCWLRKDSRRSGIRPECGRRGSSRWEETFARPMRRKTFIRPFFWSAGTALMLGQGWACFILPTAARAYQNPGYQTNHTPKDAILALENGQWLLWELETRFSLLAESFLRWLTAAFICLPCCVSSLSATQSSGAVRTLAKPKEQMAIMGAASVWERQNEPEIYNRIPVANWLNDDSVKSLKPCTGHWYEKY